MHINKRAYNNANDQKYNPSKQFPLPGDQEYQKQYKGRHKVNRKSSYLLPKSEIGIKGIQSKNTDKTDGKNTNDSRKPINKARTASHNTHLV